MLLHVLSASVVSLYFLNFTMKKLLFILFLAACGSGLFAQKTLWTTGNARTLAKGQQEFGIIQPFQIGITDKLEASFSPLAGLSLVPNVSFKYRYNQGPWLIASQHTYMMPSMLLHSIQENQFNFLPPGYQVRLSSDLKIPFIFTFRNQILVTRMIGEETLLTGNAGIDISLKTGNNSQILALSYPAIYRQQNDGTVSLIQPKAYPLLYLWSTTLMNKVLWHAGVRVDGNWFNDFNYMAQINFISSGFNVEHWAIEHKGYFIWNKSVKFAALIGYNMSYRTYPDLTTVPATSQGRFFIFPVADLIWKLNIKREPAKDLFRVRK